jgi:hypothetical protein
MALLRRKFVILTTCIRKEKRFQINSLSWYFVHIYVNEKMLPMKLVQEWGEGY